MQIFRQDKTIHFKIVYHGPALCGKTTNLQRIFSHLRPEQKLSEEIIEIPTQEDLTLTYDCMPMSVSAKIRGYTPVFSFYTVPGQVHYKISRRLILDGADGIVFVADSQARLREENKRMLDELLTNLSELHTEGKVNLEKLAIVKQFNKRDLTNILSVEEMCHDLVEDTAVESFFEASALNGEGVLETMQTVVRQVISENFPTS